MNVETKTMTKRGANHTYIIFNGYQSEYITIYSLIDKDRFYNKPNKELSVNKVFYE